MKYVAGVCIKMLDTDENFEIGMAAAVHLAEKKIVIFFCGKIFDQQLSLFVDQKLTENLYIRKAHNLSTDFRCFTF